VRRQANWFKVEDQEIQWFEAEEANTDQLERLIRAFLN
jgi:tRNA A37 N6-isopentenylltransferase MiaA